MEKAIILICLIVLAVLVLSMNVNIEVSNSNKTTSQTTTQIITASTTQTTTENTIKKANQTIPIRVFIDESSGKGLTFFDNYTVSDVRVALKTWENRTKVIQFIEIDNGKIADIVIKWSSNLTTVRGKKVVGEAWYRVENIGGTIYLLPSGVSCRNQNRAMHEIGHLFGLNHSTDYMSVMYQYESCAQSITNEDVNKTLTLLGIK
jgi:predicted Zn-dependent protease